LLGDEKLGQGTIEECFSGFFQKKNKDGEEK